MSDATASFDDLTRRGVPHVLAGIRGQESVVSLLSGSLLAPVHAYLFHGPPGSGKRNAALCFAAALLCPNRGCGECPTCVDVRALIHPDVTLFERTGSSILVGDAREISLRAQRTPRASRFQVLILDDFHLVDEAGPALLKTIEEPSSTTIFIVLAESVPASLTTIASRCIKVAFAGLSAETLESALVDAGVEPAIARRAAEGANGRMDRALLLARDPSFASRQGLWRSVIDRLDGTGSTVVTLVSELQSSSDSLVSVLHQRHEDEIAERVLAAEQFGERRVTGRAEIEARHRREIRRLQTDELRAGLQAVAGVYRARLMSSGLSSRRAAAIFDAIDAIDAASAALHRNPNTDLLLANLLLEMDVPT